MRRECRTAAGTITISEYVFHRRGKPLADFRKVWKQAWDLAKLPGILYHDLRRSGIRDMVNAGVPQSVAMAISCHRTVSVFNRYAIASPDDMREAMRRTQRYRAVQDAKNNVKEFPAVGSSGKEPPQKRHS